MLAKVYGAAVIGIEATLITIEVNCSRGIKFMLVGLPDISVKESHERIISALQVNNHKFPRQQIIINMSPADIKKEGSAYDLPLAIGILAAAESIAHDKLKQYMLMGELSLDGSILPIKGSLPIAIKALELGFKGLILPLKNAKEAGVVKGLEILGVENITEVIDFYNGTKELIPTIVDTRNDFFNHHLQFDFNFSDVKGQENVKRAIEVAAAGGHNLIMVGPPGSGKSMIAKRIPSILPPFTLHEALETTKIHSVAGKVKTNNSLMPIRPFRAPHHSISNVAMAGGGAFPQPGEISLAHNGVLFLDELPEFNKNVLEVLRQPLEDRTISISRSKYSIDYPASFMLVASMNPCPCGYYNHPERACICSQSSIAKYMNKVSGPLLDRIDIQIEIAPVSFEKISNPNNSEESQTIRNRVISARQTQFKRYKNDGIFHNAQMTPKHMQKYATPDSDGLILLKLAMNKLSLSARAYDRILKVSRTIADLDYSDKILSRHIAEAINYRNMDRENWGIK